MSVHQETNDLWSWRCLFGCAGWADSKDRATEEFLNHVCD